MKKLRTKNIKSNMDYHFTQDELVALGKELGEDQLKLRQLDDDRKMVADEWKAKISSAEARINSLSNKVSSGYEYRDVDCTVTLDDPVPGDKTIRRNDTGAIVKIMPMEDFEKQEELPLEEAAGKFVDSIKKMGKGTSVTVSTGDKSVTVEG